MSEQARIEKNIDFGYKKGLMSGIYLCQGLIANYGTGSLKGRPTNLIQEVIDKLIEEYDVDQWNEDNKDEDYNEEYLSKEDIADIKADIRYHELKDGED